MSREGLPKKADETIGMRNIVSRISFRRDLFRKVVSRLAKSYKAYQKTLTTLKPIELGEAGATA
jgi:hypothetical protein